MQRWIPEFEEAGLAYRASSICTLLIWLNKSSTRQPEATMRAGVNSSGVPAASASTCSMRRPAMARAPARRFDEVLPTLDRNVCVLSGKLGYDLMPLAESEAFEALFAGVHHYKTRFISTTKGISPGAAALHLAEQALVGASVTAVWFSTGTQAISPPAYRRSDPSSIRESAARSGVRTPSDRARTLRRGGLSLRRTA